MKPEEVFEPRKEEDKVQFYSIEKSCENCGFEQWFHNIPCQTPIENYLEFERCKKCKCLVLKERKKNE